jgi:hypothetical protein
VRFALAAILGGVAWLEWSQQKIELGKSRLVPVAKGIARYGTLVVGLGIIVLSLARPVNGLPHGFTKPMLALELPVIPADVKSVLRDFGPNAARSALFWDTVLAIPSYWLVFFSLSLWLRRLRSSSAATIAAGIAVFATGAAAMDLLENWRILQVLTENTQPIVNGIRHASILKWSFLGAACSLLSIPFVQSGALSKGAVTAYVGTGLLLILGMVIPSIRNLAEPGFLAMGIALLLTGLELNLNRDRWFKVATGR